MIISCEKCQTRYAVDPAKLGVAGRTVRCAKCHHNWFQAAPEDPMVTRVAARPEEPATGVARAPARKKGPLAQGTAQAAPAAEETAPPPAAAPPPEQAAPAPAQQEAAEPAQPQASAKDAIDEERMDALIRPRRPSDDYDDEDQVAEPYQRSRYRQEDGSDGIRNLPGFPRQRVNTTLIAGWMALVLLVPGLVGASFFTFRDAIAERVPASRKIYTTMGLDLQDSLPDPTRALRIQTPQPPPARSANGVLIQEIKGYVENDTDHSLPVPLLRGVLFNDEGEEIYDWTFRAQASRLEPKQSATFETEILGMPENASRVEVMFDSYYRTRNQSAQR